MGQIDDETAVRAVGDGSYETRLSANWCIGNNPNGGYAVQPVLRALADLTGRPDPTSVTVHYLRPALADADADDHDRHRARRPLGHQRHGDAHPGRRSRASPSPPSWATCRRP